MLDKPRDLTSQQAVTRVKRMLGASKAGHGGTLDPAATGVLPIYLNQATRLAEYALDGDKEYLAEAVFGVATTTQDESGDVVAVGNPSRLTADLVQRALMQTVGSFAQLPPQYSALKVRGKPAYAYARQGETVELQPRAVTVHDIRVEEIMWAAPDFRVRFYIRCSKGTYIRTVCHDLGERLGVPAHMATLRRTKTGAFSIGQAHTLESVERLGWEAVIPPEAGVDHLRAWRLDAHQTALLRHGQTLVFCASATTFYADETIRVHDDGGELIAICAVELADKECVRLRPTKVFSG